MFIAFKNFKILYCDDYKIHSKLFVVLGGKMLNKLPPRFILKLKYDF